jgi:hypothetical protein
MPVDTANKRKSAVGIRGLRLWGFPTADLTIDATDRRSMTGLYSGIATTSDTFVFWRETTNDSVSWSSQEGSSFSTDQEGDSSTTWVKTEEVRD